MDKKRKVYAPFSQTSEAGVTQTPVEGYIDVNQTIYPTVQTGVVNEKGTWVGVKSSDDDFFGITKHVAVANGGETLSPDTGDLNFIDMTGFRDLFIAVKPTRGGSVTFTAVMGPGTNRFANLQPVNAGASLIGNMPQSVPADFEVLFTSTNSMTVDVWNIFIIGDTLRNQKNMQFKIVNGSGGNSNIEVAFMRVI